MPLDQVVFERQRLFLVMNDDAGNVARLEQEAAGLGVGKLFGQEIGADAVAQAFGLADVDHPAAAVAVLVNARRRGQGRGSLFKLVPMIGSAHPNAFSITAGPGRRAGRQDRGPQEAGATERGLRSAPLYLTIRIIRISVE